MDTEEDDEFGSVEQRLNGVEVRLMQLEDRTEQLEKWLSELDIAIREEVKMVAELEKKVQT